MSNMALSLTVMLTLLMALGYLPADTPAQHPELKQLPPCKTAEEALSDLRAEGLLPVAPDQILVAGNVRAPQSLTPEAPITILMALAMAGGVRADSSQSIFHIRRSPWGDSMVETAIIDLVEVKRERSPDVQVMGGGIVYVPQSCTPARPNRFVDPVRTVPRSVAEEHPRP